MAHSVGFEPTAYGLEVRCSIQLSYECIKIVPPTEVGGFVFAISYND